eukprot:6194871-Pleurochrysis_carterae.AAC.2
MTNSSRSRLGADERTCNCLPQKLQPSLRDARNTRDALVPCNVPLSLILHHLDPAFQHVDARSNRLVPRIVEWPCIAHSARKEQMTFAVTRMEAFSTCSNLKSKTAVYEPRNLERHYTYNREGVESSRRRMSDRVNE